MGEARMSRRAMLAGMGVATGAVVAGRLPAGAATTGDGSPPGLPTVQQPGQLNQGLVLQALPALNPAWNYRTLAYHHFFPRVVAGLNVGSNSTVGQHVTAPPAGTNFFAALDLPQGAVIREAAFECYNVSTASGLGVGITRTGVTSSFIGGIFAFTTSGGGKHTVVVTPSSGEVVDNTTYAYGLSAFLQPPETQFGFFGARVAWSNGLLLSTLARSARMLDTRAPGPLTGKIVVGQTKVLALTPDLPAGAKAALVNLTVAETEGYSGYLSLFAAGTGWPGTSSVNWALPFQNIANSQTVAVSATGAINILCGGSPGNRAHVIVDLVGYYT